MKNQSAAVVYSSCTNTARQAAAGLAWAAFGGRGWSAEIHQAGRPGKTVAPPDTAEAKVIRG
jgi:hypothetical protein